MVSTTAQPLRASSRIACHRSRLEQGSIPELGSSCRKDGAGVRGAHRGDALREQRGLAGSPRPAACSLLGLREPTEPPALQRLRPQRNAPFVWQQRITCNFRGLTLSPSVEAAVLRVGATSERRPWTERRIPVPFAVGSSGRASRESLGSRPPRGRRRREPSETWLRAGGSLALPQPGEETRRLRARGPPRPPTRTWPTSPSPRRPRAPPRGHPRAPARVSRRAPRHRCSSWPLAGSLGDPRSAPWIDEGTTRMAWEAGAGSGGHSPEPGCPPPTATAVCDGAVRGRAGPCSLSEAGAGA